MLVKKLCLSLYRDAPKTQRPVDKSNAYLLPYLLTYLPVSLSGKSMFIEDTEELFSTLDELVAFYSETSTPAGCTLSQVR